MVRGLEVSIIGLLLMAFAACGETTTPACQLTTVVEVKLVDVSPADAPAMTIGRQIIERPRQVPTSFEIEYDPSDIDERLTYGVHVRILDRGRLAFVNDMTYQVITRGNTTHVDMIQVVADPAPTGPAPAERAMIDVVAPIDAVRINIA